MRPEKRDITTLHMIRLKNLDESIRRRLHSTNQSFGIAQNRSS
jgi:hypothetical protein